MRSAQLGRASILILVVLAPLSAAAAPRRVLVVHSFGIAAPPFTTHSTAFEKTLTEELAQPVDLDEVSLDMARYDDTTMHEAMVEYLQKRYAQWQPDLVVPIGSPAGVFIAKYRTRLFSPIIPIIYTGMDQRRLPPDALQTNAAFVGESFDFPAMVEDMLQVAPATTNIAVVIGASQVERYWTAAIQQEWAPFTNRLGFTWLNELSFDQMLDRVSHLPPRSFVFLVLLMRDATGVAHDADEALRRIHAVANAPVNSIYQHQLGLGIVGGRLYQAELEGVESARIAVRVLRGESATQFQPRIVGPTRPRYDWHELHRWRISESHLPPGSTVQFREPGFWELYKGRVLVGIAVFCAVVVGLHLRHKAQLRETERHQAALTRQFILSQEEERKRIAGELHDGLSQMLVIMKNKIALLRSKDRQDDGKNLDELAASTSQAINEVRTISQALRPVALEQVGITAAIELLAQQVKESSTARFSSEIENIDKLLPQGLDINLYRIVQEGLNNVLKHAHANNVILEVKRLPGQLSVEIFDDGVGFDPDGHAGAGQRNMRRVSLGFVGMTERANALGGSLEFKSAPGRGTRVSLAIPLKPFPNLGEEAGESGSQQPG
jgi:signal transduction histidine kinase